MKGSPWLTLGKFVGWRLARMAFTLWAVFSISFFLMRFAPGGPFASEKNIPEAQKRKIEERYKMDQPLWRQYFTHMGEALSGDFGICYRMPDFTVNQVIREGFPVSACLGIFALVIAVTVGTTAGVISAMNRNSPTDYGLMASATVGISAPSFVIAGLAIMLFVFMIPLFPAGGWGRLANVPLPALCLAAPYAAYVARLTRAGMLEVLSLDYIRTAYAKGLSPTTVVLRHALKGGLLPVISYLGPAAAGILTGSLVVERIFNIRGLGSHFVEAAIQRDYTLAMGMILVYTCLLYSFNLLVDLSYAVIDPRVKLE